MEAQRILTASVLDIVFDGRNKEYGAYILRKEYNKHLTTALVITGVVVLFLSIYFHYSPPPEIRVIAQKPPFITELSPVEKPPKAEQPKPISHPPAAPPRIRTVRSATPVIVNDPPKEEMPPENAMLENARIGNINADGPADDNIAPPQGSSNGVTGIEKTGGNENTTFIPIELESTYPGGLEAWKRFLIRTVHYPEDAQANGIQGTVIVQFIVDIDGTVSNVEIVSGPQELTEEAIRVIKKSGKWTPAIQNGRKVKSYKKQPITFHLSND